MKHLFSFLRYMYQKPIKGSHIHFVKSFKEIQFSCLYFFLSFSNIFITYNQGQKNRFFRSIFRRKIGFRWWWKRFSGGKIFCKKIGKKSAKIADFSEKIRYFPEKIRFFPKKSDFSRYLCKLYFRSLREEILKNGANQSCRIKKSALLGKIIHV